MSLKDIAVSALKKQKIEPTKERINSVVASIRVSGVDVNDNNAVIASADFAVKSSLKFDGVSLFKKIQEASNKKIPQNNKQIKPQLCGLMCPRCGKPLVLAHIDSRDVGYCTAGCNIAVPFPVKE